MLSEVSLELHPGEVLGVVGENGAGKSTLMKILAGVQPPDSGEIQIDGKAISFSTPRESQQAGICLIHQELNLCDNLNVGQNIFLGREPTRFGLIDSARINRESHNLLERVGLRISPRTIVGTLSTGKQQMVEIAKALSTNAKVLILDEPTSSLSAAESASLFLLIEELKRQNVAMIYISHRLAEVRQLCDRVLVLRDGKRVGELTKEQMSHEKMVSLMVGRDIASMYSRTRHKLGSTALKVNQLVTNTWPAHPVSFEVAAGEIVGIAGLVGSGRTELLETIFGIRPAMSGKIEINGKPIRIQSPRDAIENGLALVPEDRKQHGLIVEMDVRSNLGMAKLKLGQHRFGFANLRQMKQDAADNIQQLGIKTTNDRKIARYLSGGNQQKIVIGKWLAIKPGVLLLDEPTRGIDIGAKQEIYRLIEELTAQNLAIVCVSSELEEIMGLSDRVLVMHEGKLVGELRQGQITEESIMRLATNQTNTEANHG